MSKKKVYAVFVEDSIDQRSCVGTFTKAEEADKAWSWWTLGSDWSYCWIEEYDLYTKFSEAIYE